MGVTVIIQGTTTGTVTNVDGSFTLSKLKNGKYILQFHSLGLSLDDQKVEVTGSVTDLGTLEMIEDIILVGDQLVVSASRRTEKITEAPATIGIINSKEIEQHASFNIGELLARQKGVDYVRSGVQSTGINIRGFNSAFNTKILQINDNRISTLVAYWSSIRGIDHPGEGGY